MLKLVTDTPFEQFWAIYPRRVAKGDARRAWAKVPPDLYSRILEAVRQNLAENDQWRRDGGRFIPYPATWLNQERWDDELTISIAPLPSSTARAVQALELLK